MPTFGEFETVGEPVAVTREAGHTTYIWQARRANGGDEHDYAIKCYAPRPRRKDSGSPGEALGIDRGLEFIGGVKQLEQVRAGGGRGLARIYGVGKTGEIPELGLTVEGAWYATDFCKGKTLKEWIQIRGRVDAAALRNVVTTVVSGCLALQRSRGFGHGNVKPSNVLLTGPTRPLRSRPLLLIDPYPSAPSQLDRLEPRDRDEVSELLKEVVEARDLRALGELILQLVEGRLVGAGFDYDYPIQASSATSPWRKLGKQKQEWLDLCNQLLDPQLKLEQVNFESLSRSPQLKRTEWGPVLVKAGVGVAAVAVLGGTVWGGLALLKTFKTHGEKRHEQFVKEWDDLLAKGRTELENTNFEAAVSSFGNLKQIAQKLEDTSKTADSSRLEQLAQSLHAAKLEHDKAEPDYISVLKNLASAGTHLNEDTNTTYARWCAGIRNDAETQAARGCGKLVQDAYVKLDATNVPLAQVQTEFTDARNYAERLKEFRGSNDLLTNISLGLDLVAKLDGAARALNTTNLSDAETQANDVLAQRKANQRAGYVVSRVRTARSNLAKNLDGFLGQIYDKWGGTNNVPSKLTQLAANEFAASSTVPVTDYFPPPIWSKMGPSYKAAELSALEKVLSAEPSRKGLASWSKRVEEDYKPVVLTQVASGWPPNLETLKPDIERLKSTPEFADPRTLDALTNSYNRLESEISVLVSNATRGGFPKRYHEDESQRALVEYHSLSNSIFIQKSNLAGAMKRTELVRAQRAYTNSLATGDFSAVKTICANYASESEFKTLAENSRKQEKQLDETVNNFQKALTNGDYSVVFANELFASNVTIKALSKQALAETNRLAEARTLLQDCEYQRAMDSIKEFPKENKLAAAISASIGQEQRYYKNLNEFIRTNGYQEALAYFQKEIPSAVRAKSCFSHLYNQANDGLQKDQKFNTAKSAFDSGSYSNALVLCNASTGERRFVDLREQVVQENKVLANAASQLDGGQYAELETALQSRSFTNKPPFIDLLTKSRGESRTLARLQSLESLEKWPTLNNEMKSLQESQPVVWRKPPFQKIVEWLTKNDQIAPLDQRLALYEVWFGVLKNSGQVVDPQTKKPAKAKSSVGPGDLDLVNALSANYDSIHSLTDDRKARLSKITSHIKQALGQ